MRVRRVRSVDVRLAGVSVCWCAGEGQSAVDFGSLGKGTVWVLVMAHAKRAQRRETGRGMGGANEYRRYKLRCMQVVSHPFA